MTTFKPPRGKTYRYDFWWTPPGANKSVRYTGNTDQFTKDDADLVEAQIKKRVRQEAHGIAPFDRMQTPSFSAMAALHLAHVKKRGRVTRVDELEKTLRLCLQFWGRRPKPKVTDFNTIPSQWRQPVKDAAARAAGAPYHDLRLADPIADPHWIERFEDWLTSRRLSGPRKNHYRSAMSGLYRTALLPKYRKQTNVTANPFLNIERDRVPSRLGTLTLEQLRAWMAAAPPHARVAMAIATYAPELRLGSILKLQWTEHLDPGFRRIVTGHKTERWTGMPQVIPVSVGLHEILTWWKEYSAKDDAERLKRRGHPSASDHVIRFQGRPIGRLGTTLRASISRANQFLPPGLQMVYGTRQRFGVTFHSLRHTMATLMAEWEESEAIRQLIMGHLSQATTQKYTHLTGAAKTGPLARISGRLQLGSAVLGPVQERPDKKRELPNKSAQSGSPPAHAKITVSRSQRSC